MGEINLETILYGLNVMTLFTAFSISALLVSVIIMFGVATIAGRLRSDVDKAQKSMSQGRCIRSDGSGRGAR